MRAGLLEWGGPSRCTEEMAIAMGFASVADLFVTGRALRQKLDSGAPLPALDWLRVLLATEIVFASDTMARAATGRSLLACQTLSPSLRFEVFKESSAASRGWSE